jgi:hypothetical protein
MPRSHDHLDRATAFLGSLFALQLHHLPARHVLDAAAQHGIDRVTLWRAARLMGITATRVGFGPGARSVWSNCRRCVPRPPPQNDP